LRFSLAICGPLDKRILKVYNIYDEETGKSLKESAPFIFLTTSHKP